MAVWVCELCGFEYDESKGLPADGIAAGTRWVDIPDDWACPYCGARKNDFRMKKKEAFDALSMSILNP